MDSDEERARKRAEQKKIREAPSPKPKTAWEKDAERQRLKQQARNKRQQEITKKQKEKKDKEKKRAVASQNKEVDVGRLDALISSLGERFPGNGEAQIKVLADYFEVEYAKMVASSSDKLESFPSEAIDSVSQYLDGVSREEVSGVYGELLDTLVEIVSEGAGKAGHQGAGLSMLLQLIARSHPFVLVDNASSLSELWCHGSKSKSIVIQLVAGSPSASFALWISVLLPLLLNHDQNTSSAAASAAAFFSSLKSHRDEDMIWGSRSLGQIDDDALASGIESLLEGKEDEELSSHVDSIYSMLITPAFLLEGSDHVIGSGFFGALLAHASDARVQDDVLSLLATCLKNTPECFQYWEELYPTHVSQSLSLMDYLTNNWKAVDVDPRQARDFATHVSNLTSSPSSSSSSSSRTRKVQETQEEARNAATKLIRKIGRVKEVSRDGSSSGGKDGGGSGLGVVLSVVVLAVTAGVGYLYMNNKEVLGL
eukprot:TRINITY_DN2810_c0_g1_i2.p1 TRINITY_DN2810_c0_g1~~TRINITY_DN2810_c0_g1_i2.p1  ORF type:complete len:566 (-),score=171.95 TRINITY_DN2810_c0_g1_i2:26-1474(-)